MTRLARSCVALSLAACVATPDAASDSAVSDSANPGGTEQTAAALPFPIVARGHEPGWTLSLTADSAVYIGSYGADTARVSITLRASCGNTWSGSASAESLAMVVRSDICRDGATGMPHPYAVVVRHGGREVSGCGGEPAVLLAGGTWTVREAGGTGMVQTPPTMDFAAAGRAAGTTSCNQYSAPLTFTGEGLRFGPAISTKMACQEPLMTQEAAFLGTLARVRRMELPSRDSLLLVADDGTSIVAVRERRVR